MTHLLLSASASGLLLAQLSGPWCGQYGSTPFNNGSLGCTVPSSTDPYGTRLIEDPYTPGGVRAVPAAPAPMPVFTPGSR
jgi:hypothetical protein